MMYGANLVLAALIVMFFVGLFLMAYKPSVLDFVKANFGLFVLLLLFMTLLAISFHTFHEASTNSLAKDFLAWLEQKAGEVLASIMTVIVGARAANQRTGDNGNGNGNGTTSSTSTGNTSTAKTTGNPLPTGIPH
jgi:hypothetical protein